MANPKQPIDEETKLAAVRKILSGEGKAQKIASELGVQSYQLHAWIGYLVAERPDLAYEALDKRFAKKHSTTGELLTELARETGVNASSGGDLTTQVMAEYLRRVLSRGTPN